MWVIAPWFLRVAPLFSQRIKPKSAEAKLDEESEVGSSESGDGGDEVPGVGRFSVQGIHIQVHPEYEDIWSVYM